MKAIVKDIKTNGSLNIVTFDFNGIDLKMVSLELPDDIKKNSFVNLNIKSTAITIAKNLTGDISISNKLFATIIDIQKGELLCSVKLKLFDIVLEALITIDSLHKLDLKIEQDVMLLIKATDISIR